MPISNTTFTTDMQTDIGKVRLLLFDLDPSRPIFPDDAYIQVFLDEEGTVKSAAALGYETIAGNRLLTLQVIQILDLKTDGLSVARGFQQLAKSLRDNDQEWSGIMWAEVTEDSIFALREKYWKLYIANSMGSVL